MEKIEIKGYAKINLFLEVISKLENGYHEVNTVMQTLSLADSVYLEKRKEGIILSCDESSLPIDEKNIAYRAAKLFFERSGCLGGVKIDIIKRIPMEAGLAGGSADAAATLIGLNALCDDPFSREELLLLGGQLGADVPFCMIGGTAYADKKGDRLKELCAMPFCYVVIVKGERGVSTPWAYGELDRIYHNFSSEMYKPSCADNLISALSMSDICAVTKCIKNIFEDAVIPYRAEVSDLKDKLLECGALGAMMSGSGTAVFGIFTDKEAAENCLRSVKTEGYFAELAVPTEKRL